MKTREEDLSTGWTMLMASNPLTSSILPEDPTDGRTVSVFLCGTCSNSSDATNTKRYFQGENVSHTYSVTQGEEYVDKIIVDGPGSGENDIKKLWVNYPNIYHIKRPGLPYDKYTDNEGIILGRGLDERVQHIIAVLKNKPTKKGPLDEAGKIAHEKLKNAAPIKRVNIVAWSRGAAWAIKTAHHMANDPELKNKEVNLILLDPVPGAGISEEKHRTLPSNVKNCYCIYARDERSACFSSVIPDSPKCDVISVDEEPNVNTLNQLKNIHALAYVFCGEKLFYVNKTLKECIEIPMQPKMFKELKKQIQPRNNAKTLSKIESQTILTNTGHTAGCHIYTTFLPGGHAQVAGDETDHAGKPLSETPIPGVDLKSVGIISRSIIHQALSYCGTKLDPQQAVNVTLKELIVLYQSCKKNSTAYKLRLMTELLPEDYKSMSIITKNPVALYQFDDQGKKTELLGREELEQALGKDLLEKILKMAPTKGKSKRQPIKLPKEKLVNLDKFTRAKGGHNHINYYAEIAQRTPYIFSQLAGEERKIIDGNETWFNQYISSVQKDRFPKFDPAYIDHTHQAMIKVTDYAKILVDILCQYFEDKKNTILDFDKNVAPPISKQFKEIANDDILLYRAISEEIQSRWKPDDLKSLDKRCHSREPLETYVLNVVKERVQLQNSAILAEEQKQFETERERQETERKQQAELLKKLENERMRNEQERKQLEGERELLKIECELFNNERKQQELERKRLLTDLKTLNNELTQLKKTKSDENQKLSQARTDIQTEREQLEIDLKQLSDEREQLENEYSHLKEEQKRQDEARKQLKQNQQQLTIGQSKLKKDQLQLTNESAELKQHEQQIRKDHAQLVQEKERLDDARKQLEQEKTQLDQVRLKLENEQNIQAVERLTLQQEQQQQAGARLKLEEDKQALDKKREQLVQTKQRLKKLSQEFEAKKNRLAEEERLQKLEKLQAVERLNLENERRQLTLAQQQPVNQISEPKPSAGVQLQPNPPSASITPRKPKGKLWGAIIGAISGAVSGAIPAILIFVGIITLPATFGGSAAVIGFGVVLLVGGPLIGGGIGFGIGTWVDNHNKPAPPSSPIGRSHQPMIQTLRGSATSPTPVPTPSVTPTIPPQGTLDHVSTTDMKPQETQIHTPPRKSNKS
jgi:hypothetical protein